MVIVFSLLDLRKIVLRNDVTEEAEGVSLVATFLALTGACQGALGESLRLLQATGQRQR